jgi:hypothetical protein
MPKAQEIGIEFTLTVTSGFESTKDFMEVTLVLLKAIQEMTKFGSDLSRESNSMQKTKIKNSSASLLNPSKKLSMKTTPKSFLLPMPSR